MILLINLSVLQALPIKGSITMEAKDPLEILQSGLEINNSSLDDRFGKADLRLV